MGEVDFVALGMIAVGAAGLLAARWLGVPVTVSRMRDTLLSAVFAAAGISGIYFGALTARSAAGVMWVWALVRLSLAWRDRRGSAA